MADEPDEAGARLVDCALFAAGLRLDGVTMLGRIRRRPGSATDVSAETLNLGLTMDPMRASSWPGSRATVQRAVTMACAFPSASAALRYASCVSSSTRYAAGTELSPHISDPSRKKLLPQSIELRAQDRGIPVSVIYKLQSCSGRLSNYPSIGRETVAGHSPNGSSAWTLPHPLGRNQAKPGSRHREGKEVAGRSKKATKPVTRRSSCTNGTSYDQWARNTLAVDAELTGEYLREILEQSDTPEELLIGLRRIAEAQGMSRVAEAAGLSRESLYRSLSATGNPRLSTLVAVLRVAGLKLSVRSVT